MAPPRTRPPLTLESILAASVEIADRDGLAALSIRSVASALNARPMSLYSFIDSKDDLVRRILDTVLAEMLLPDVPDDWRAALHAIARRTVEVGTRHPWIVAASLQTTQVGTNREAHAEQTLAVLTRRGIDEETARHLAVAIDTFTIGFAALTGGTGEPVTDAEHRAFTQGLDWLLDGFEQTLRRAP